MRVLIVGTRSAPEPVLQKVRRLVGILPGDALVITGCRPDLKGKDGGNVDKCALKCAQERGLRWEAVPANFKKYGPAGGPIRNREMVEGWWVAYRIVLGNACGGVTVRRKEKAVIAGAPYFLRGRHKNLLPDWAALSAALIRNGAEIEEIARCPKPDLCFAFHDGESNGTAGTLDLCVEHNIPYKVGWL